MSETTNIRVGAVIVAYNVDADRLLPVLSAIRPQVEQILLVDNSDRPVDDSISGFAGVTCQRPGGNVGVGTAHNLGIRWAEQQGLSHLLLMDHDSMAGPNMVAELVRVYRSLGQFHEGRRIAAVGPSYRNSLSSQPPSFYQLGLPVSRRIYTDDLAPDTVVGTDFLISSGTLLSLDAVREIGPMREEFFIDRIDTDWCLRARALGFCVLGACSAHLTHRLGDYSARIWWGYWRNVPIHAAERYYYMVRNSVLLYRTAYIGWSWILFDASRLIGTALVLGLGSRGARWSRLRHMWLGLMDGCRRRSGRRAAPKQQPDKIEQREE